MDERQQREELEARMTGLAGFHLRRGQLEEAEECLDLAEGLKPGTFRQRLARSRLAILRGSEEEAILQLRAAREVDPFDEFVCDLLAEVCQGTKDLRGALEAWADARVLSASVDADQDREYDENLDALLDEFEEGVPGAREALIRDREERSADLAAKTMKAARKIVDAGGADGAGGSIADSDAAAPTSAAELLKATGIFPGLSAEDLEVLEGAILREAVEDGESVFKEGQPSEDIYVVERGQIRIQRETPFGVQTLATVGPGSVFGEMNFIDGFSRSADALAVEDSRLVRVSHAALHEVFEAEPTLALAFLREFWKGLADKVREANELMKSFFDDAAEPDAEDAGAKEVTDASPDNGAGGDAELDADARADVLDEQGLGGSDLRRLAEFAEARTYDIESPVFREGDEGDALFVIVDGQVRISKNIPGVGEEALAVLERGDFFGEMSLIDGSPRSATAKSHASGTTVLRISKTRLQEMLDRGGASAIEMLSILCRLLSARLREINDKIIQWRMMSGGF